MNTGNRMHTHYPEDKPIKNSYKQMCIIKYNAALSVRYCNNVALSPVLQPHPSVHLYSAHAEGLWVVADDSNRRT